MELVNYNYVLLFFCLIIICYFVILSVNLLLCLLISYSVQIKSVILLLCLYFVTMSFNLFFCRRGSRRGRSSVLSAQPKHAVPGRY